MLHELARSIFQRLRLGARHEVLGLNWFLEALARCIVEVRTNSREHRKLKFLRLVKLFFKSEVFPFAQAPQCIFREAQAIRRRTKRPQLQVAIGFVYWIG